MQHIKISIISFLLCFMVVLTSQAQDNLTQTIKGTVVDSQTKQPLLGVNILVLDSEPAIGTITDENGLFRLENIPVGRASLAITYLGYEDYIVSEILVGSAKEVDLTISLIEAIGKLDEVVLVLKKDPRKPNNSLATVSARSFSLEETKRFPASISDPGRMALSFAGVSNSDDETNEIVIRGNAPNQLLWKIEGVEVPEPNHFSEEGYSPGAISLISTNILGKSDFLTGAFPSEYGNATSGVFDINLRNGNADKKEYAFQFGVLGADFSAEGPFSKNYRGSYLINYRYSTLSLLNQIIEVSDSGIPTYQDVSFKVNLPINDRTKLSIWGIGGISDENIEEEFIEELGLTQNGIFKSKTYMSGLTFTHFLQKGGKITARASYSGNESDFVFTESNTQTNQNIEDSDFLQNASFRFNLEYLKKFNAKTTLKSGVIYSALNFDVSTEAVRNETRATIVSEKGNSTLIQGFTQLKHRFTNKFSSSLGVHATSFSINDDFVIEPRIGFEYKISTKHLLSAGIGMHSRRMPLNQYFIRTTDDDLNQLTPNKNIDLMRATHYILGYDWQLFKKGHLKIEAYYQVLSRVAVVRNPQITDSFLNGGFINAEFIDSGSARNYGVELTLEKFFSDQYYFLSTLSVYDSKYQAADSNWYNSAFNYNYIFNMVGGKEFTVNRKNVLGINGRFILNGGKRGTPYSETGDIEIDQTLRNTLQFSEYLRLDMSVSYRVNRPKVSHVFSLDIQNVSNRENVDQQFLTEEGSLQTTTQLGIIPFINYKIEF